MTLTAEQQAVVDSQARRLVVRGGPGTGRTTTLAERYLALVSTGGVAAGRALIVCRDQAAARRSWSLIEGRVGRTGYDVLPATSALSLAWDIVARSGRDVHLVMGSERRALVRSLLASEPAAAWPVLGRFLGRPAFATEVASALEGLDGLDGLDGVDLASAGPRWAELALFAERYRAALSASGGLDVAGLMAEAAALAPSHGQRFDHLLVDDADHLTPAAGALLAALAGEQTAVTAVYPLGHGATALAGNGAQEVALTRSFRAASPGRLVRCAHPSIEAEAVTGALLEARAAGVAWSEMAVLVRALDRRARSIGRAMARHGVPAVTPPQLAQGEPVVDAVVDLLRWVGGDGSALDRLLVSPLTHLVAPSPALVAGGAGPPGGGAGLVDPFVVRAVRQEARAGGRALEDDPRLAPLVALRDHLRARAAAGDRPSDLAYEAWGAGLADLGTTGLGAVDDRALDGLVALVDGLAAFEERHGARGASLAQALAAWDEGDLVPSPWRLAASAGTEGVTISSIAASAGREWHTVVLAGCVEGELPRTRTGTPLFDPARLGRPPGGLDDERALFGLATSRATAALVAVAAPEPGVLLSRFVEDWPPAADVHLPLAPGRPAPARPMTAGAVPLWPGGALTLSATQLATYDDCPLRYAYSYGLRARDVAGVHANLGTLVHQVLATFLGPEGDVPPTQEGLLAVAERVWTDDIARYRPQAEEARRDFVTMLAGWWEDEGPGSGRFPDVVATEHGFEVEVGPHRLVGSIDRLDRVPGGLRVVDYKTGKKDPSPADVADDLQLAIYHLAVLRDTVLAAHGPPVALELHYLRSRQRYTQAITADHPARTESRVLEVAARIVAEELAPSVEANCRTCAFHRLCPLQDAGREVGIG